jgi:hypothetical protein
VVGALLLLGQVLHVDLEEIAWPLWIILPGAVLLILGLIGGRHAAGLAIPACILTATGLIFLYQELTGHWESWAYAWALILVAIGVGQMLFGARAGWPRMVRVGRRLALMGLVFFLVGAAFFEGVLGISGRDFGPAGRIGLPALVIAAGLALLVSNMLRGSRSELAAPEAQHAEPQHPHDPADRPQ